MDDKLKDLNDALQKGSFGAASDYGSTIPSGGLAQGTHQSPPPKPMFSFNRFVVEPYVSDRTVKTATTGRTEFARIEQKISVKGLRLLVDITLDQLQTSIAIDGISQQGPAMVKAGSIIFIREELLHTQPWAKAIFESEYLGKFLLVEKQFVEFIAPV
jgi:hypothetical protein